MSDDGTIDASVNPATMITAISETVESAVNTITGKVDAVRAAGDEPCTKEGLMQEFLITKIGLLNNARGSLAAYRQDGDNAINASIVRMGRPGTQHQGGQSFAAFLVDGVLPQPDGVILAVIFGGPIGAAAASAAWTDWIDNRVGTGRPSESLRGTPFMGNPNIRTRGGRIQGPEIAEAYDQWVISQTLTVTPPGRPNWSAKVDRLAARIEGLEAVVEMAMEWQQTWQAECIAKNRTESERIDLTLEAQLDQARELARTERLKALAPYIAASLLGLAFIRSRS